LDVKKLILHVGLWKTGTTTIQSYLSRAYPQLKSDGVLYPKTSRLQPDGSLDTAHHRLSGLLREAEGFMTQPIAAILGEINKEIHQSRCDTVMLSSETFFGLQRPEILRQYFAADEVQIIATFRNQPDFLSSMYYTDVCHRKVIDYPMEYLENYNGNLLDYAGCLAKWRNAWPAAQFSVSLFERGTTARDFPAAHVIKQIGLDWDMDMSENRVEHRSLPAQATLFLRQLSAAGWPPGAFFDVFEACHRNTVWFAPVRNHFSPTVSESIFAQYAPQNAALAQHFITQGPTEFSPPNLSDPNEWTQAMGEAQAVFSTVLRRISKAAAQASVS
tara:strand:- start:3053 stop:4042 length:990 start_codon:yes stop_codon:yes gene_type:complete